MKPLIIKLLAVFSLLVGMTTVSLALPACPSDQTKRYGNCFGTYIWASGSKYVGNWRDYLWFANKNSSSSVQYRPDGILKPKNYKKYKDRQNR